MYNSENTRIKGHAVSASMNNSQWKNVKPNSTVSTKTAIHSKNPSYAKPIVAMNSKGKVGTSNKGSAKKQEKAEEVKNDNEDVVFTIKMTKDEYMDYIQAKLKKKGF